MRRYYDEDGVVIYHGDCRDALASLTDIPGMDYKPLRGSDGSKRWTDGVQGDAEPFDPAPLLRFPRLVLFGANWYADRLPASGGWLVWDKTPKGIKDGFAASHAELAWTNLCSSVRKFSLQWGGEARNHEPHLHPTQKPVGLMRWIVEMFTEPGDMVLDPYMGSGPVAQACRETGRGYLGFEIEERYCEAAVRRFAQGTFELPEVA
jgi:site-specific DNA-methyltransferase (adenine-specific)